ncbi:MAG: HIT domain-containing protein, partial [bacterium]|nr:HIT domain-containing protein [bacterium]
MSDCLFCKIISGELPSRKLYEDDSVVAFLDIFPAVTGHTLVVPKAHAENIFESSPLDLKAVME